MSDYDHKSIEQKWQRRWADTRAFAAPDRPDPTRKYYVLEMFPYPSGNLHMGHVRNYAIGDLIARFYRTRGKQVLHPMGWDAFGMPAENAAIKDGIHPSVRTPQNIANVKRQFQMLGMSYDWDREIGTYQPEYYRWNQWFFLKFLERGLIYRAEREVNWCPKDETILANEQVVDGKCWRCESAVVKRLMPEWSFRITAYAQQLLDGIEELVAGGWPDRVTSAQRNWIGKSTGLECDFGLAGIDGKISVFTTRADTIHGATYVVLAPEHPLVARITTPARKSAVNSFVARMKGQDKIARTAEGAVKEGVDTGARAVNPFTGKEIPVWLANFVLADYGTGAVMSVPAHDQRDFEFARKYGLDIKVVIAPTDGPAASAGTMAAAFTEDGVTVDSAGFSGVTSERARQAIIGKAASEGFGKASTKWHLRDWGFARQRYWGTPIPIINCPKDGAVPVPEKDLPVLLPKDAPLTGEGGSPLAKVPAFMNVPCPKCGGPAKREAETMDTFVDSTWYFARFLDPTNSKEAFGRANADAWLPVDIYIGGPEHAVLHLLYFRFWTMVMKDMGLLAHGEPAKRLLTQGIVHKDGAKMSKSLGNVVSPDDMVEKFGADTARVFSLFAAPPEKDLEWNEDAVSGSCRFLKRTWNFVHGLTGLGAKAAVDAKALEAASPAMATAWRTAHAAIESVSADIGERFHYNTGVSTLMKLLNDLEAVPPADRVRREVGPALRFTVESLLQLLNPYAPHITEELWEKLGHTESIVAAGWPVFDPAALVTSSIEITVQVMGKLRGHVTVPADATEETVIAAALADAKIKPWVDGKELVKRIYVARSKILNLVVKG